MTAIGPRGGTTTRSKAGMVRKNFWLTAEMADLLREKSFEERRSESDILREGLKRVFGLSGSGNQGRGSSVPTTEATAENAGR